MKISFALSILLIFLFACGGSGGSNEQPIQENPITLANVSPYQLEDTSTLINAAEDRLAGLDIDDFFEESYKMTVERDHESIIADGRLAEFQIGNLQLNNIGDDFYAQTVALQSKILELLLTYDRSTMSNAQQLSFDVYQAHLEFEIEAAQYRNFEYPATYGFFGWPGSTEGFFTQVMQISNKADADNYLALLNQVGRRFEQIEALLDARQAAGIVEPSITLGFSQSQVANIAQSSATSTTYYAAFNTMVSALDNISAADKDELNELLIVTLQQRVIPAYQSLSTKMLTLLASAPTNIGFGQFTGGDAFYDYQLRFFTSSVMTADDIHQLGLDELARIHNEMRALFDQLGYPQNETIAQLYARVDQDAGFIPGDQAIAVYENLIDEAYVNLPLAFEQLPQQEVVVIGDDSGGYYIAGSDDGVRPGAFYAYTAGPTAYTTMPTLAYHEAVPGHHLQIALAQELNLPTFRRKENFTSFVEGWGLYAERLAKDLGWYQNDIYGDLGRLQFEAMRAARLVLDTAIHDQGWTYQQSQDFHQANVGFQGSIARYSVWPGQATAYTTGMLKILELRERAENLLGGQYDIREFHTAVVGNGSMPLSILETVVDNYIAEKLAAP